LRVFEKRVLRRMTITNENYVPDKIMILNLKIACPSLIQKLIFRVLSEI